MPHQSRIQLDGFNNLAKSLSVNLYDVHYVYSTQALKDYQQSIQRKYNARCLAQLMTEVANSIDAHILNIACQDYEPHGASSAILMAEEPIANSTSSALGNSLSGMSDVILAHLDKSHMTAHSYPENNPGNGINTFRLDIDISTCGLISPLSTLNNMLDLFKPAVAYIDYRVRGFTRDKQGRKHYIDHRLDSIQDALKAALKVRYVMRDHNHPNERLFLTKLKQRQAVFAQSLSLFGAAVKDLSVEDISIAESLWWQEVEDIFVGRVTDDV